MAERKAEFSEDDKLIGAILVFVAAAALAALLAAPIIVGFWLWLRATSREFPRMTSGDDFRLTLAERRRLEQARPELEQFESRHRELMVEGAHLARRADGAFNERSQLGKRLNETLRALGPEISRLRAEISRIEGMPGSRRNRYVSILIWRHVIKGCALTYAAILIGLLALDPDWLNGWFDFVSSSVSVLIAANFIAAAIGAVVLAVQYIRTHDAMWEALANGQGMPDAEAEDASERLAIAMNSRV